MFKINNHETWLNVILAIVVFEYLHLLYTDAVQLKYVFGNKYYQNSIISLLSYIDLLYLPFIYYMFYKRMRWGWIALFGIKLLTLSPWLLFYFKEYWPVEHGFGLLPYSMIVTILDIPILIFLSKQEICDIFKVSSKTKWITVLSIVFMLALLGCVSLYNQTS